MKRDAAATVDAAQVHCTSPDPQVQARALCLCGQALHHLGHTPPALRLLRQSLAINAHQVDTWRALANVLAESGHRKEAIQAWRQVAVRTANEPTPWLKLAELHRDRDDHASAATAVQQAMLRAPRRADLVLLYASDLDADERTDEAHAAVIQALTRFPNHIELHLQAAEGYSARANRAMCLQHLNTAIQAKPRDPKARARRALFYVQTREFDAAAADLAVTLETEPNHKAARLQEIRLAILQKKFDHALQLVNTFLLNEADFDTLSVGQALLYRADLNRKHGRYDEEWADLVRGQALLGEAQKTHRPQGERYLTMVGQQTERLKPGSTFRAALATMPTVPPTGAALIESPPVFMFGFPRSGTTLAERVLGAHPNLTATDELNLLGAVCASIMADCDGVPAEELTEAQVRHLRQVFAKKAVRAGFDPTATRLIDKNPLNLVFMDIIRRVFPDSPVVMLLRDPRDCIWSAFRQSFEPNPALVLTHDLVGTATLYRTVLDCWQHGRTIEGLNITEIHYEHIVTRFEATARMMVQATGEAWDSAVLDYRTTLGKAFVRTPSFAAVGQKVTSRRVARWLPHTKRMDAIVPILGTHLDAYGVHTVAPELQPEPAEGSKP